MPWASQPGQKAAIRVGSGSSGCTAVIGKAFSHMLNSSMNAADVLRELPRLRQELEQPDDSHQLVPIGPSWPSVLLVKQPGFRDWILWHHRVFHKEQS